ncbi:MAG TPA: hypothetical protein VMX97_05360 [Hyphomicrobiaceae bacterium]|nr:hypothetical protein [Hyphomicrobiaceae bacterium]
MAHSNPQFTPAQILAAGQRAEADGRIDDAIQFFRHLAEHYPETQEAGDAGEALARITRRTTVPQARGMQGGAPEHFPRGRSDNGGPHAATVRPGGSQFSDAARFPSHGPAGDTRGPAGHPRNGGAPAQPQGAHFPAPQRQSMQIAPAGYDHDDGFDAYDEVPVRRRGYWVGRFLAFMFTFFGAMLVAVGIAFSALIFVPDLAALAGLSRGMLAVFGTFVAIVGPGVALTGVVFLLFGQLSRAIFDSADAARYVAELHTAGVAAEQRLRLSSR